MSSDVVSVAINDKNKPTNIPDYEEIIAQAHALRPSQETAINISGARVPLNKKCATDVDAIWVKYGGSTTISEARTQQFVKQYLKSNNITTVRAPHVYLAFRYGHQDYIVSEYIDGRLCNKADVPQVAAAIQDLIAIQSPTTTPGPVGGGLIEHPFFVERESNIWYESVDELQAHINGVSATLFLLFSPQ